jgi:hypothetical protein
MARDNAELIRLLEAELDVIEGGGYGRSPGEAGKEKPMFYHSIACINHWLIPEREESCNDDCMLMDFVPAAAKGEPLPCHLIVLNESGETVRSLATTGDQERLEREVKNWLRATIARLKAEEAVRGDSASGPGQ